MAEQDQPPPSQMFTGRIYTLQYGVTLVIPIPLGNAPTTDPVEVQNHIGKIINQLLRQMPMVTSFRLTPEGTPTGEEGFYPSPDAVVTRMHQILNTVAHDQAKSKSTEAPAPVKRLIVMPGGKLD